MEECQPYHDEGPPRGSSLDMPLTALRSLDAISVHSEAVGSQYNVQPPGVLSGIRGEVFDFVRFVFSTTIRL